MTEKSRSDGNDSPQKRGGRLACADFSFSAVSHETALDIVSDLGFEGVTLGFFSGLTRLTPEAIRGNGSRWGGVLARRVEKRRLAVVDIFGSGADFTTLSLNHPDPLERSRSSDLFRDLVEIAVAVGAPGVTLLPGAHHAGQDQAEALELSATELRWRVDEARSAALRLSVEPHVGSHIDTPEKVIELLDLVPGLELTLDYGHFHVQGIPDVEVDPLLARARHFHCRGATYGNIQANFDNNTIDFARIVDTMSRVGYEGWIEVEYICWAPNMGSYDCDNLKESAKYLSFFREQGWVRGDSASTRPASHGGEGPSASRLGSPR